jgi:uncharacterized phiE125 gp8 family phage protein
MSIKVITPAVNPIIALSELKAHLYIVGDADDTELTNKMNEVKNLAESFTNRFFLNTVAEYALDSFPIELREIWIPKPPLVSVSKVEYYDTSGVLQEMDLSDFYVDTRSTLGRLVLKSGKSFPITETDRPNAVIITFTAGYGANTSDLPLDLKSALKLLIANNWENRQEDFVIQGVGIKSLPKGGWYTLWSYKWDKGF